MVSSPEVGSGWFHLAGEVGQVEKMGEREERGKVSLVDGNIWTKQQEEVGG